MKLDIHCILSYFFICMYYINIMTFDEQFKFSINVVRQKPV